MQAKAKRINSRSKGATFERLIASQLSKWCGFACKRTPSSGGWAKTGDITPRDPKHMVDFPFCLELKKRECWDFSMVMGAAKLDGVIGKWWQQCKRDAALAKKTPMLIFTKNRDEVYCLLHARVFKQLGVVKSARVVLALPDVRIFKWEHFLKMEYRHVSDRLATTGKRQARGRS